MLVRALERVGIALLISCAIATILSIVLISRGEPALGLIGVCLAIGRADGDARELFVGDTLFAGSIGRTDLPGGDSKRLLRSIRDVLFRFPDETVVHSGHGPDTTIGEERRTNPFLT